MKALFHGIAIGSALVGSVAGMTADPASAQSRKAEIIVYGTDPCPRSTDDQIVVCSRRPEGERFRIPPKLRPSGSVQSRNSWVNQARSLGAQGGLGPLSCTAVGPTGYTGCAREEINDAARESRDLSADAPPK